MLFTWYQPPVYSKPVTPWGGVGYRMPHDIDDDFVLLAWWWLITKGYYDGK